MWKVGNKRWLVGLVARWEKEGIAPGEVVKASGLRFRPMGRSAVEGARCADNFGRPKWRGVPRGVGEKAAR